MVDQQQGRDSLHAESLRNLRRLSVGPFGLDEAVALEQLAPDRLLPPVEALRGRPRAVAAGMYTTATW